MLMFSSSNWMSGGGGAAAEAIGAPMTIHL